MIVARGAERIFSKDASAGRVKIYDILFLWKTLLRLRLNIKFAGAIKVWRILAHLD